jgi:hypothetical protein
MEIDITQFLIDECPKDYSASAAEIGDNAGACTWRAAVDSADPIRFIVSEHRRDEFRRFLEDSGGWSKDEIEAFNSTDLEALFIQWVSGDLEALFIQWVSGDLRDMFEDRSGSTVDFSALTDEQWSDAEQRQHDGKVSQNIYRGDDGRVYFYIGA